MGKISLEPGLDNFIWINLLCTLEPFHSLSPLDGDKGISSLMFYKLTRRPNKTILLPKGGCTMCNHDHYPENSFLLCPSQVSFSIFLMKSRIFAKARNSSWQLCDFHFLSLPDLVESKISLPITQQCVGPRKLNLPSPWLSTPKCQVPNDYTCLTFLFPCLFFLYINLIILAKHMEYTRDVLSLSPSQKFQNPGGMMAAAFFHHSVGFQCVLFF